MKKLFSQSYKFAIKQMERASRYIVISGLIAMVLAQLTIYSQWDVMIGDMGRTLIAIANQEDVQSEEVETVQEGL
jgi:hypothetical protein